MRQLSIILYYIAPDADLLILVCQVPPVSIVVVVSLHLQINFVHEKKQFIDIFPNLLCGLPKVVLDAPLGRQVVVVARVLRDLDLPLPGGHGVSPAGPGAGAELEGELVAALGGLHIHWRRVNATKKSRCSLWVFPHCAAPR